MLIMGPSAGPCMVDGTEAKSEQAEGLDDMTGVAPENRVHVARLRNMSQEELDAIGDEECEERRWRESLAEIP